MTRQTKTSFQKKSLNKQSRIKTRLPQNADTEGLYRQLYLKEKTYRGISIATTICLYCILFFMLYIYFNYEIFFFPKM